MSLFVFNFKTRALPKRSLINTNVFCMSFESLPLLRRSNVFSTVILLNFVFSRLNFSANFAMAESFSEVGKAAVKGALDVSLEYMKLPQGGKILIHVSTDNIQVAKELCKLGGYVGLGIGAVTLGGLLGYRLRSLIKDAVNEVFGGRRDDQDDPNIRPGGSLHVLLHCLTDERFLEVLEDYESGGIKERLQKEFSQIGIEVEGLKVEIENMKEVEETRAAILDKRYIGC
jgi:hypothetical protein